jgi:hypothetical protein
MIFFSIYQLVEKLINKYKIPQMIAMDYTVIFTISIILVILALIFALFYHAFSIGKEEEED